MFRIARLILTASAAGTMACSQDSPTEPAALAGFAPELLRDAPIVRPAGGTCRTEIEFQASDVILIQLDCNLLHLGRTSGVSTQTITVTGQTPAGELVAALSSSPTYTAANGDVLRASFTGTGIINPAAGAVTFSGTETFSGGTGRFADASGSVALSGSASLVSNTGSYQTTGSLAY